MRKIEKQKNWSDSDGDDDDDAAHVGWAPGWLQLALHWILLLLRQIVASIASISTKNKTTIQQRVETRSFVVAEYF